MSYSSFFCTSWPFIPIALLLVLSNAASTATCEILIVPVHDVIQMAEHTLDGTYTDRQPASLGCLAVLVVLLSSHMSFKFRISNLAHGMRRSSTYVRMEPPLRYSLVIKTSVRHALRQPTSFCATSDSALRECAIDLPNSASGSRGAL
ncbi:hypothetical protein BC834DRAFT_908095 [Gloeopeniophorella convolvens]|nr:hypothetical protein BC834DRAFT_908095 [Gloeopeniophorella convolvens]